MAAVQAAMRTPVPAMALVTRKPSDRGRTYVVSYSFGVPALLDEAGQQMAAAYQGNLEAGTALDIALPVTPIRAADYAWTFSVSYETADGNSHTLLQPLAGTVAASADTDTSLQSPVTQVYDLIRPKDSASPPFWCWLLVAGGLAALAKLVMGQMRTFLERKRYYRDTPHAKVG